jgi:hypothetical protein
LNNLQAYRSQIGVAARSGSAPRRAQATADFKRAKADNLRQEAAQLEREAADIVADFGPRGVE